MLYWFLLTDNIDVCMICMWYIHTMYVKKDIDRLNKIYKFNKKINEKKKKGNYLKYAIWENLIFPRFNQNHKIDRIKFILLHTYIYAVLLDIISSRENACLCLIHT